MTPTEPHLDLAPRGPERRRPATSRSKALLGWTGAAAVLVAGTALATVTFTGDDTATVETLDSGATTPAPACTWSSEVDGPVFPERNIGAAPTPDSVLVFEHCDGDWTGDVAWLNPGQGQLDPGEPGTRPVRPLDE